MTTSDVFLHAGLTPASDVELYPSEAISAGGTVHVLAFSVTAVGTATADRTTTLARAFAVSSVGGVTVTRVTQRVRTFAVNSAGVVTVTRRASLARAFVVTSVGGASMVRSATLARTFSSSTVGLAALGRSTPLAFSVVSVGWASATAAWVDLRARLIFRVRSSEPRSEVVIFAPETRSRSQEPGELAATLEPANEVRSKESSSAVIEVGAGANSSASPDGHLVDERVETQLKSREPTNKVEVIA